MNKVAQKNVIKMYNFLNQGKCITGYISKSFENAFHTYWYMNVSLFEGYHNLSIGRLYDYTLGSGFACIWLNI